MLWKSERSSDENVQDVDILNFRRIFAAIPVAVWIQNGSI